MPQRKKRTTRQPRHRSRRGRFFWADLPDDELLDLRLCDLNVSIAGTVLEDRIERLYENLAERGLRHRPHIWLSSEWFSPDGVPGIAIPFYLAHERLMKLEQRMMLEVEGGTERTCMKILRHEAGHTICTAYRLHYRKSWRETFGRYSEPYPDSYRPKPNSRDYVLHLGWWYAQVHPAEDFAETFAVWLRPNSRWRQQYKGWRALEKLEYVDRLMNEIADRKPVVRSRLQLEPLREMRMTLREHYRRKRRRYGEEWPEFFDGDLRRLFSDDPKHAHRPAASSFLRKYRRRIRESVAHWTGTYQYTIDQVLGDMIDRCRELKLRLIMSPQKTLPNAMIMVTVQTMNFIHGGHYRIAL